MTRSITTTCTGGGGRRRLLLLLLLPFSLASSAFAFAFVRSSSSRSHPPSGVVVVDRRGRLASASSDDYHHHDNDGLGRAAATTTTIDESDLLLSAFMSSSSSSSSSSTWDAADDWNALSSSSQSYVEFVDDDDEGGVAGPGRWESSSATAAAGDDDVVVVATTTTARRHVDPVEDAIESISSNLDYNDPEDLAGLYDTVVAAPPGTGSTTTSSSSSTVTTTTTTTKRTRMASSDERREEDEIALVVRCDRAPKGMLVETGRALPELTDAIKYSPGHLLLARRDVEDYDEDDGGWGTSLPLMPIATPFLDGAVRRMFRAYAVPPSGGWGKTNEVDEEEDDVDDYYAMDRDALSRWMTACVSSSLPSAATADAAFFSSSSGSGVGGAATTTAPATVGPYDRGVSAALSRYSREFGSGRLRLDEFRDLYLEATWAGYVNDVARGRITLDDDDEDDDDDAGVGGRRYRIPQAGSGIIIEGRKNTERMILGGASLSIVWRDLEAHGIFSPSEEERVLTLLEMERTNPSSSSYSDGHSHPPSLMDECELFEDYEERLSRRFSEDDEDDVMGVESAWDFLRRKDGGREKSSHELVEMAFDGKTPKRIRDGQFVFIDEETCIGCSQCAQIAPSSFKMIEDSGRARTYQQSSALDVENAVAACPVNCMHFMSFDELKEMEVSRDDGDGRSDHRHFGKGRAHTPLHVSGRDSDANHKSSWYHYLKTKCHGSASCPQRGCYDCPTYAPGENPFFKERHKQAEHIRAKDFMMTGEADKWRKVIEL